MKRQDTSWRRRGGFTLIEVLIALGLFAVGAASILGLFLKNLQSAKLAREEVVLGFGVAAELRVESAGKT